MACSTTCAPTNVSLPNGCGIKLRLSNGRRLVAFKCNYEFTDITDSAEWATALGAGNAIYSPECLIAKPAGSPEFVQTSFGKKTQINTANAIALKSFDTKDDFSDFDFWNKTQKEWESWKVGWLTADDAFYLIPEAESVHAATEVPEGSPTAVMNWVCNITYNTGPDTGEIKPIAIPGLSAIIDAL